MIESTIAWIRAGYQDAAFRQQAIVALGEGFCPHHHVRLTPIHRMSQRPSPLWSTHQGCDGVWALQSTDRPREGHLGEFVHRLSFRIDLEDPLSDPWTNFGTIDVIERRVIVDLLLPEEPDAERDS